MDGVRSGERIRREWVVEWDEPELDRQAAAVTEDELADAVRRHVAKRVAEADQDARPVAGEPMIASDSWLPGEPSF